VVDDIRGLFRYGVRDRYIVTGPRICGLFWGVCSGVTVVGGCSGKSEVAVERVGELVRLVSALLGADPQQRGIDPVRSEELREPV
jgi:hypothetical protein